MSAMSPVCSPKADIAKDGCQSVQCQKADVTQILLANGLALVQGKLGVIELLLGSVTTAR